MYGDISPLLSASPPTSSELLTNREFPEVIYIYFGGNPSSVLEVWEGPDILIDITAGIKSKTKKSLSF